MFILSYYDLLFRCQTMVEQTKKKKKEEDNLEEVEEEDGVDSIKERTNVE